MPRTRTILPAGAAVAGVLLSLSTGGCSPRYSAERDGKKLGEAICRLDAATTPEEAADARSSIDRQLDDLARKHSLFTAEDRRDIERNLADLAEHAVQGNDVLTQQDLAVLARSARNVAEDSVEIARAAAEGVGEGLQDCTGG